LQAYRLQHPAWPSGIVPVQNTSASLMTTWQKWHAPRFSVRGSYFCHCRPVKPLISNWSGFGFFIAARFAILRLLAICCENFILAPSSASPNQAVFH
jgi:hypothetical protein